MNDDQRTGTSKPAPATVRRTADAMYHAAGQPSRIARARRPLGARSWLLGAPAAAGLAFAFASSGGSCGGNGDGHQATTGSAGSDGTATSTATYTVLTGGGGQGGSAAAGGCGVGSGGWSPERDSCWRPVNWPAPCEILVAEQPELAVPPLEWEPCSWEQEGCSRLKIAWPTVPPNANPVLKTSVVRRGDGYWTGLLLQWIDDGAPSTRAGVWGADGVARAAWRGISPGNGDITYCDPRQPVVGESRVWIGGSAIHDGGAVTAAYVSAAYAELSTATQAIDYAGGNQGMFGNDDTLALAGLDGLHVTVVDRLSGAAKTFGSSDLDYHDPNPVADSVLATCYLATTERKACIWNRSTQEFAPLIAPPDYFVASVGSDGATLAWSRCPRTGPGEWDWTSCKLWTSPFATNASDLQPSSLCSAPGLRALRAPAGDGLLLTWAEDRIYVYRLSDGWHWTVAPPPGAYVDHLVYIDAHELWYQYTFGIVRQRLDALGAGAPCPAP